MSRFTFSVYFALAVELLALVSSHEGPSCMVPKLMCYETIDYTATTVQSGIKSDLCDYILLANSEMTTASMAQFNNGWLKFKLLYGDRVKAYQAIGAKVIIALGSWSDSNSDKYAKMMSNSQKRAKFIRQSIEYILDHNLNGMQIEYTNPVCRQLNCAGPISTERSDYTRLLKEMSAAYTANGLSLSILVDGRQPDVISRSFDLRELSEYVDFITVYTEHRVEKAPANTGKFIHQENL